MALQSSLVPLGTPAPTFALPNIDGRTVRLADFAERDVLVIAFVCNHCPYVQHIEERLGTVAWQSSAAFVAICSNDAASYPDDSPKRLREQLRRARWGFPYLIDAEQRVAKEFGAVCTPDFFVYGPDRLLGYRGAFDESTPKNAQPVDGSLIEAAIAQLQTGEPVPEPHRPSMGCSIKWLPRKEPQ